MYELLSHLRVRLGQQPNTGQVAKNKVLGCTSQAYADDLLRQAKINQSKLEKHNCFKRKLTLVLIRESSSQGCKKDKKHNHRWGCLSGRGISGETGRVCKKYNKCKQRNSEKLPLNDAKWHGIDIVDDNLT